ncbi:MAG: EamA family transporter [Dermatophilaceae bacterium]
MVTRIPAPLLVLGSVVSVQFGGALAATLVPVLGAAGSVVLRLVLATSLLLVVARPRWRGHSRRAWMTVAGFGAALGLMNFAFYGALAYLPLGVAVTLEFIGPLALAAALSRRWVDAMAVLAATVGVVMISKAFDTPSADLPWVGILLALSAGAMWAAYIVLSGRVGAEFPRLDGLAIAMVIASLVTLPFGVTSTPDWTGAILLTGCGIAVLSSVLPYSLELLALRRLSARVFGILLSLEPACAALAGLLVLGQHLERIQLVGMGLVIMASAIVLGLGARQEPAESATT